MDGWGSYIWRSLPDDHFVVEDDTFTIASIHRMPESNNASSVQEDFIARASIRDWAHDAASKQNNIASGAIFQCLIISTHDFNDYPVDISRDDLFHVANILGIPPIQTQLLFAPYTGYVGFDRQVRWYLGRPGFRALASTNPDTGFTCAIMAINKSDQRIFEEVLRNFSGMASHPLMLALVLRDVTLKMAHTYAQNHIIGLRDAERLSGFHAEYDDDNSEESINSYSIPATDLGKMSKKAANDASNLGNLKIILARLVSIKAILHTSNNNFKWHDKLSNHMEQNYATKSEEIIEIDAVLESIKESLLEALIEYQDRARNLQSVLFNLIAKEDANASIQLARDSRTIAVATKKDGESMKTIAIMTMIFLPGTFFSSLFAVPTLQWEQSPVIQGKFWVYWAFTIPSTILILTAWYLLGSAQNRRRQVNSSVVDTSHASNRHVYRNFSDFLTKLVGREPKQTRGIQDDRVSDLRGDDSKVRAYGDHEMADTRLQMSHRIQGQHTMLQERNDVHDLIKHPNGIDRTTRNDMA